MLGARSNWHAFKSMMSGTGFPEVARCLLLVAQLVASCPFLRLQEAEVMAALRHPHCLSFLGVCTVGSWGER